MQVGYEKIDIFDQYLASSRVINSATVTCCKQSATGPWQVGDTHRWSCVQHSSDEAYLTVITMDICCRAMPCDRRRHTVSKIAYRYD